NRHVSGSRASRLKTSRRSVESQATTWNSISAHSMFPNFLKQRLLRTEPPRRTGSNGGLTRDPAKVENCADCHVGSGPRGHRNLFFSPGGIGGIPKTGNAAAASRVATENAT